MAEEKTITYTTDLGVIGGKEIYLKLGSDGSKVVIFTESLPTRLTLAKNDVTARQNAVIQAQEKLADVQAIVDDVAALKAK